MDYDIQFKDLMIKFGKKTIIEGYNLDIKKGEKVLISGKSGTGKSSLIKALLGFIEYEAGEIFVQGSAIEGKDFREVRNQFAYVNQDVTIRKGNVKNYLLSIQSYKHNTLNFSGDNLLDDELMEYFEFDPLYVYKNSEDLSGGERQRLGIILAIMLKRPIFLLDEITSGLDKEMKKKTVDYFAQCEETVIAISHDQIWEDQGAFRKVGWA
jgi:putative ABC transport system ATP-binding protein